MLLRLQIKGRKVLSEECLFRAGLESKGGGKESPCELSLFTDLEATPQPPSHPSSFVNEEKEKIKRTREKITLECILHVNLTSSFPASHHQTLMLLCLQRRQRSLANS